MPTIWRVSDELWEKIEPILKKSMIRTNRLDAPASTSEPP
jgi:hypothetical protein